MYFLVMAVVARAVVNIARAVNIGVNLMPHGV